MSYTADIIVVVLQFPQVFRSKDLSSSRPAFNTSTISAPAPPARALSGVQMQPTSAAFVPKSPSPSPSTDSLASSSWATVGKTTGGAKNINIAPKKAASRRYMLFSKEDERIDEDLPKTDYMAEKRFDQRVKNVGKCCNDYHLRGECPIGTKCRKLSSCLRSSSSLQRISQNTDTNNNGRVCSRRASKFWRDVGP